MADNSPQGDSSIRRATLADLSFLTHLQRKETAALGFIPYQGVIERIEAGRVLLALENGQPAAFALFDVHGRNATVHQAAALYDARRRGLCSRLVQRLRTAAGRRGAQIVRLACAIDLPALAFWDAAGFVRGALLTPINTRRRALQLFEAPALSPVQLELPLALPAGRGDRSADSPAATSARGRAFRRIDAAAPGLYKIPSLWP